LGKTWKRTLCLLTAIVMLAALLPPATALAAATIVITNPLASGTSQGNPLNVTTGTINIEFQYSEISDTDFPKLYYVVDNVNTGFTREVKDSPPQKQGTNRGVFTNVELTEGLNRIVIRLDAGTRPVSAPLYVNYTEVTTIINLTIDGRQFSQGIIAPASNASVADFGMVFIEGLAPNATEVIGYTSLLPAGDIADVLLPDGRFSFSAGHAANAELPLRPGDNDLTIEAANAFKSYRTDRRFVYNNGESFLFNTVVASVYSAVKPPAANDPDGSVYLFRQPTFEGDNAAGPFGFAMKTDIKINKMSAGGFLHDRIVLSINGTDQMLAAIGTISGGQVAITWNNDPSNRTTHSVQDAGEYYLIRDVTFPGIGFDTETSLQIMEVRFSSSSPAVGSDEDSIQAFHYYFVNRNEPYIESVKFAGTDQEFYSGIEIFVQQSSFDLEVQTKQGATQVVLYLVDNGQETELARGNVNASGVATLTLNKESLPEGTSLLRFVPVGSGGKEYKLGAREYLVRYNPAPYVYVTNITNGQVFSEASRDPKLIGHNGQTYDGPVLQIRPVNIPENQFENILVRWNGVSDWIRMDASKTGNFPDGLTYRGDAAFRNNQFVEFRFYFGKSGIPFTDRSSWGWNEGLNTLVIEVYDRGSRDTNGNLKDGAVPITTIKYELFYFTDNLPDVVNLDVTDEIKEKYNYQTLEGQVQRYYTQGTATQFTATFKEAETVEIRFYTLDQDGKQVTRIAVLKWGGNQFAVERNDGLLPANGGLSGVSPGTGGSGGTAPNGNGTVVSQELPLYGSGTHTVEVIVTNNAGISRVRMMEIVREPALFLMHYPVIDQHPVTKAWEGRVNGNFTRVILEAEGADKIIYGKNQEVDRTVKMRIGGVDRDVFVFEVKGLKRGNNKVELTIVRGNRSDKVEINFINADTAVPGAVFKESVSKTNIKAFNGLLQLKLERGTVLMRNSKTASDQYLSPTRELLFAIADPDQGRVNKYLHPIPGEQSPFEIIPNYQLHFTRIQNINMRFRKVSPLFWIDAGFVPPSTDASLYDILYGSGVDPYERGQEFHQRSPQYRDRLFVLSKPGELTLAYDPNMVQSSWRYVTVFHYGYDVNSFGQPVYGWKNIGGVVNPKNNTITVNITDPGFYVVMYLEESFNDVIAHPWARDFLDTLYAKGVMNNKESTRFETNEPITRGEFVSLIVKALDLPLNYEGSGTFSDVNWGNQLSFGLWDYKYIETAARAGIARGTTQGRFLPNNPISRQDAASLLARAMNLNISGDEKRILSSLEKQFTDASSIDYYARASVDAVTRKKLMEGKPNVTNPGEKQTYYFDPTASLTRAEAAAIIMKMLLDRKRIPHL